MSGNVKGIPGGKTASVLISYGDCLDPKAPLLGRSATAAGGRFFLEVFTKWGADVTMCAAIEASPGQPSTLYAKAGPFHAEAEGEVEFKNVEPMLKEGPPIAFPTRLATADGKHPGVD